MQRLYNIVPLWEMLKNASEVTLVAENIFFLKILNFVQFCGVQSMPG
jgi:hypothetical protein